MQELRLQKRVNERWIQVLSVHTKAPTPLSEVRINPVLLLMTWQLDTEVWTGSINKTLNFPSMFSDPR